MIIRYYLIDGEAAIKTQSGYFVRSELAQANLERAATPPTTDGLSVRLELAEERTLGISENFSVSSTEKEIADLRDQIQTDRRGVEQRFSGAVR